MQVKQANPEARQLQPSDRKLCPSLRKRRAPRYPVREWLGKYEAWLSVMGKSYETKRLASNTLERFLGMFPYRGLEQFTSTDTADYIVIREREKSKTVVDRELLIIRTFWQWLIEQKGLFLYNIVKAFANRSEHPLAMRQRDPSKQTKSLELAEILRLIEACETVQLKTWVIELMSRKRYYSRWRDKYGEEWNRALHRANLPSTVTPGSIKIKSNRIARQVTEAYVVSLLKDMATV